MVRRPYQSSGTCREIPPEVRNWSGDPPGGPEVVGRPFGGPKVVRRSVHSYESCTKALSEVREWSGFPPRGLGVVEGFSRRSGTARKTIPEFRNWL